MKENGEFSQGNTQFNPHLGRRNRTFSPTQPLRCGLSMMQGRCIFPHPRMRVPRGPQMGGFFSYGETVRSGLDSLSLFFVLVLFSCFLVFLFCIYLNEGRGFFVGVRWIGAVLMQRLGFSPRQSSFDMGKNIIRIWKVCVMAGRGGGGGPGFVCLSRLLWM